MTTLRLPWWNTREFIRLSQEAVARGDEHCDVDSWAMALTDQESWTSPHRGPWVIEGGGIELRATGLDGPGRSRTVVEISGTLVMIGAALMVV